MTGTLRCEPLPGLVVFALAADFPQPLGLLGAMPVPAAVPEASAELRTAVRDMLRQKGYRPTGRGKPSSEYLATALADGRWPQINVAVDAGNHVSLASGLPISVVDRELLRGELSVATCGEGAAYVFNAGGQTIDLAGLVCLHDEDGPCANAVKDAQRTKTRPETTRVLAVVWGCDAGSPGRTEHAAAALAEAFTRGGATVARVETAQATA